jgi:hypothetical protein
MYIVLTRDICHPESQEWLFFYGNIVPLDTLVEMHKHLGIDETLGHFCMSIEAARLVQASVLAEFAYNN